MFNIVKPANNHLFHYGTYHTVQLVSRLTRSDSSKQENVVLVFVSSKATEFKPIKLETSQTVILPLLKSGLTHGLHTLDITTRWHQVNHKAFEVFLFPRIFFGIFWSERLSGPLFYQRPPTKRHSTHFNLQMSVKLHTCE